MNKGERKKGVAQTVERTGDSLERTGHSLENSNIQPANKAVEHLINSYDLYWRRKQKQSKLIL